jgi:hypothetical protein
MVRQSRFHRRSNAKRFVDSAKIVVHEVAEMNVRRDFCGRQSPAGNSLTGVAISGPDFPQLEKLAQIIRSTSSVGSGGTQCFIAPELTILVGSKPAFTMGQARGVKIPKKQKTSKGKTGP